MNSAALRPSVTGTATAYLPALRRYFRRRASAADVEDLVQEVCLNVQARRSDSDIENLEAYLFTVARHVLARHAGALAMRPDRGHDLEAADFADPAPDPQRRLLERDALTLALRIIEEMPKRTRDIFVMHRFEEMTYAAIARRIGISVSAVEKHMMAALRTLLAARGHAP
jgi:RNA polymerase sigma-70 factor (ECF subfamily)